MTDPSRSSDPLPAASLPPAGAVGSTPLPPPPKVVYTAHTPRAGELTPGWRLVLLFSWIAVVLAFAAVWNASVQLGLSTWWLGPRGSPEPRIVQLSPFVAPVLMALGTINHIRWLGWWGLVASGVLAVYGIVDLRSVASLAAVEIAIAGAAAAISVASLTGTYRSSATTSGDSTT